jgi:serine phosphatase RsbU (regulator of sigma subunit)
MLPGHGFPLGTTDAATFETQHVPFSQGDMLICHSDCIIETTNGAGVFISDDDLKESVLRVLRNKPKNPAQAAVDALIALLRAHNPAPVRDDNTINIYYRNPLSD